ncbi:LysR family transcriptional regulator [Candidatus Nitrotoga sp. HW29]|uniref:LysR family transcriptional regulator n=1 Tax=Candidatus Nitrotoga sp. HW29 TaxID=2886963 RepID=UPI001EF1D382|nr:LysR family transcriptional regulator [Candidatus Nitrotoga sp. HW29]CAH1904740.1 LysR family transcriptional regulator [Candidatus Nitrotoga sp. HW29]
MEQKNISADDYILFATIVEQASLVRAAEYLVMPKATVSRRLTNLEAALGQRLLLRTTRRLTLTDFGQEFLDHCRRIAEEVATTQDFVRSQDVQPRGRLRVSMPGDYAKQHFSRAIATFIEIYPEIQLDVDLSSRRVDLIGERFDLAIRMGVLESDSTLVARKIDALNFSLYASPIYLALHPAPQHPDELEHHTAVRLLSARGSAVPWKLINGKAVWEGVPPGRLTLNSPDMIQQLLLDGAGIGSLPVRFVTEDLRHQRLVRILPKWCLPTVPAWAVMPMRRYLPAKTRAFLAHLEQFMERG